MHSAVSQIWNLRVADKLGSLRRTRLPADYKSAIRQIRNLRYEAKIWTKGPIENDFRSANEFAQSAPAFGVRVLEHRFGLAVPKPFTTVAGGHLTESGDKSTALQTLRGF